MLAVVRHKYAPYTYSSVRRKMVGGGRKCTEKEEDGLSVRPYPSSNPDLTCKDFGKFTTARSQSDMLWQVTIARRQPEIRQRR